MPYVLNVDGETRSHGSYWITVHDARCALPQRFDVRRPRRYWVRRGLRDRAHVERRIDLEFGRMRREFGLRMVSRDCGRCMKAGW